MKRKGINFRRTNHLGYRYPKKGETYINGEEIDRRYIVIVPLKDCEINENNRYNPEDAEPIPMKGHSRTNMVYGQRRTYKNKPYDTQAIYWVEDGFVYHGTTQIWE